MPPPVSPSAPERPRRRWQQRSSPLSRYALLAYLLIVIDASVFPFGGWRDLGIGPFDYLTNDWPRRVLVFDLVVNAIGYVPLGLLVGLSLHPKVRGLASIVVATVACAIVSANLEAVQTYLPARVASTVDLASNVFGGFVGALVAARIAHVLLDTGRLRMWRARWFASDASRGLVLAIVWFGALIYPDAFVFGTGGILRVLDPEWTARFAAFAGLVNGNDTLATAYRFEVAESIVAATTLVGAGLLFFGLLRDSNRWPYRIALLASFIVATIVVKAVAHAFLFDEAPSWPGLTRGARDGIPVAAVILIGASLLPSRMRWALAFAALVAALALVNIYPDNPYANAVGTTWTRGKLMNFYGLASGLNLVWPWLALIYLCRHRGAPTARRRTGLGPARKAHVASL